MNNWRYVIYCRKSSEEDRKQEQSLETQERELTEYANKQNLKVVNILKESKSAKDDGNRPIFNVMLDEIEAGSVDAVLVHHTDRLSRNQIEAGMLQKLIETGKLKEIRTPVQSFSSPQDLFYLAFDFVFASYYSRNLSVRVKEGVKTKLLKGQFPSYAPIGYINKDKNIVPDPERAKHIVRAFELYAEGNNSLSKITKTLFEEGFRTRGKRLRVQKAVISRILKEPAYYGKIVRNGKSYAGKYEPLISKQLFEKVKKIREHRARPKSKKHFFLYRDFLVCGKCNHKITATNKKEKYNYYYCANFDKDECDQSKNYLGESYLDGLVANDISRFTEKINSEVAQLGFEQSKLDYLNKTKTRREGRDRLKADVQNIDKQIQTYVTLFSKDLISEEALDEKVKGLSGTKADLELELKNFKKLVPDERFLELLENKKKELCSLDIMYTNGDPEVKRKLLESVYWNLGIENQEVVSVTYKKPYEYFSNLSPDDKIANWRRGRDSNSRSHC